MKTAPLTMISNSDAASLLSVALRILEELGVLVTHPEAVARLLEAGGAKGADGRIRLEAALVKSLIAKAPSKFKVYDRRGGATTIGPGQTWTYCGGTVAKIADWPSWSFRNATQADVGRLAALCEALPGVRFALPMVEAQDVTSTAAETLSFAETLANTGKFTIACPLKHAGAQAWIKMGRVVSGTDDLSKRPCIGMLTTLLPNFHLDDDCAANLLLGAREGIPLIVMAGVISGSTSPNTVAAGAAMKLAGGLFLAALAQIVRPGTPLLMDTGAAILDMKTANMAEACPEYAVSVAAMARVLRKLGIPSYTCALHCEAKAGDFQAGLEKATGLLTAALAGVNVVTNMGLIAGCNAASYEQLVVDDELVRFVERLAQGMIVDEDHLAWEVIREVGLGGNFTAHEHTVRHCRSGEIWYPDLLDRTAVGAPAGDLYARAHQRVEELLAAHQPAVDAATKRELTAIAVAAGGTSA